ncbi:hypothetical protein [uncultured Alistipes sp.]|jgi:hypothetical protein|uniref:hypothetical protein n=1 Tax=uncultured Alistipes sp. TaxID=538949 RepID=UPI0025F2B201|nr:hypothetical protein [uncultured Alistipes sp.]
MKSVKLLLLALCCGTLFAACRSEAEAKAPRIVNIVNFIRNVEPRGEEITEEVLYQTVARQVAQLNEYRLPATFLLQYDALINPRYAQLLTHGTHPGTEVGGWWEITQPHVEAAGIAWRGRYAWDWHADVGFATGYTPQERRILVDVYMAKFKEVFGKYPTAVGSWFIDAYTLGYMYDKYGIVASCNCKDQIGTDGYTLWGGYWNQAYYPSRVNAYMPAQTKQGQIPVPVFRMLGSDPIYQYDNNVGGALQGVISLEPVYADSGGDRQWVEWFFRSMFEEPCLAFAYTQAGQENSFTWAAMQKGLDIQIPLLASLRDERKIRVETLSESGAWFRKQFPVTPPTVVTSLTDYRTENRSGDRKTVWYNSRFYRTNLLWEGDKFRIRDIHIFDERMESDYYRKAGTTNQCVYMTLPVVDGCMWSTPDKMAGLRLMQRSAGGEWTEATGGAPTVDEKDGGRLWVEWPLTGSGTFGIRFAEDEVEFAGPGAGEWKLELTVAPGGQLPFTAIEQKRVTASLNGYAYSFECTKGNISAGDGGLAESVFVLYPAEGKIALKFRAL